MGKNPKKTGKGGGKGSGGRGRGGGRGASKVDAHVRRKDRSYNTDEPYRWSTDAYGNVIKLEPPL